MKGRYKVLVLKNGLMSTGRAADAVDGASIFSKNKYFIGKLSFQSASETQTSVRPKWRDGIEKW